MKKIFTYLFASFIYLQSFAQGLVQASVSVGSTPNRIKILLRANQDQFASPNSIFSLQFNVGVDATGLASAPTATIIPSASFPLAASWSVSPAYLEAGYWNYNIFLLNPPIAPVASANTPYEVMEVEFNGFPLVARTVGLVSLIDGGSNFQAYFFCSGPISGVASNGLSSLYYINPGTTTINNDTYDASGFNGTGISTALLSNILLPVKFISFTAIKKDNAAVLNWQIENETSLTDRYEVERSLNGVDFTKISTIAPKNNGRSANAYTSTDVELASVHSGIVYYRVKQTDKDGQFIYTEIKSIRLDSKALSASVYPNPVGRKATLSIDLVDNSPVTITVNDGNGKQVQSIKLNGLKGINKKEIDMSTLSRGNYMLRIQTNTESTTLPVVKGN
jgi:hypothetical protein